MTEPMTSANQITYEAYCQFGAFRNLDLGKRVYGDSRRGYYVTYHNISGGPTHWKNNRKLKGPGKEK